MSKLSLIKSNVIKLRVNHQLPSYLCYLVVNLDKDSNINYVNYLKSQCEHLLRVKGYYKKYPSIEKEITERLKKDVSDILG